MYLPAGPRWWKYRFRFNRSGSPQIYVMDAAGRVRESPTKGTTRPRLVAWETGSPIKPDGRRVSDIHDQPQGKICRLLHPRLAVSENPPGHRMGDTCRHFPEGRHRIVVIGMSEMKTRTIYESTWKCSGLAWSH